MSLLGRGLANQATDLQQLRDLLSSDNVVEVQLAVVDRLAATDLEEVPQWLLTDFAQRSPRLRAAILDALLSRKDWTTALLDAVESEQLAAAVPPISARSIAIGWCCITTRPFVVAPPNCLGRPTKLAKPWWRTTGRRCNFLATSGGAKCCSPSTAPRAIAGPAAMCSWRRT